MKVFADKKLTRGHKEIIAEYVWFFIEGYPGPVPRRFGDNRGVWPHRVRVTSIEPYSASAKTQYEDPIHDRRVIACWAVPKDASHLIEQRLKEYLAERQVPLRGHWHDLSPKEITDLTLWAGTVMGVEMFTEPEFWVEVDERYRRKANRRARV